MKSKRSLTLVGGIVLILILAALPFLDACAKAPAAEVEPIKVGIVGTLSGPAAPFNLANIDGFKYGINQINAEGGILGRPVEYYTRDDQMTTELALRMAKELIMVKDVDVVAGTIKTSISLAVAQYVSSEKRIFFGWAGGVEFASNKGFGYGFLPSAHADIFANGMALYMYNKGLRDYWFLASDDPYGRGIVEATWRKLQELGPDVKKLGETVIPFGEKDYTAYIATIAAANPEAVILGIGAQAIIPTMKAAKAIDFEPAFIVWSGIDQKILSWLGPEAPEGYYGSMPYLWYYPDTPENRAFAQGFHSEFGRHPSFFEFLGYLTALSLKRGYEKAGEVNADKFVQALVGMEIDSPIGKLRWRTDHIIETPQFLGVTYKSPDYPDFLIAKDIEVVQPNDAYPPEP